MRLLLPQHQESPHINDKSRYCCRSSIILSLEPQQPPSAFVHVIAALTWLLTWLRFKHRSLFRTKSADVCNWGLSAVWSTQRSKHSLSSYSWKSRAAAYYTHTGRTHHIKNSAVFRVTVSIPPSQNETSRSLVRSTWSTHHKKKPFAINTT